MRYILICKGLFSDGECKEIDSPDAESIISAVQSELKVTVNFKYQLDGFIMVEQEENKLYHYFEIYKVV